MPSKRRKLSYFDLPVTGVGTPAGSNASDDVAGGASIVVGPPIGVTLTTGIIYASAAPQSYIAIAWTPPDTNTGATPDRYTIQVSTNTTFTATGTITIEIAPATPDTPSARVDGLPPNTLHYVRLRAIVGGFPGDWSSMSPLTDNVNRITTAQDLAAAGVPTSIGAVWIGYGDLLITWTNPTEANFKDVQIVVRASSGGTIYRTTYSAAGRFLYTLAMNLADTAGAGDSSLYVELRSRTFSNVLGTIVNTGLITKAVPGTPAGFAQSWSGDTGAAGADLTMNWTNAADASYWTLTLDSVARRVNANRYTYTFSTNHGEHAGTPDPAIAYSLVAVDGFGQVSTAVSGTATNAAPTAPVATLTEGAVGGLYATVTSTPPADFWRYEFVFKRESTTVATVYSTGATYRYEMQGASDGGVHSWTVVVRQEDLFAQFSATHTPSAVVVEALTLGYLRDDIVYSDSLGTAAATLKTAMADDVRDSGGVGYNA